MIGSYIGGAMKVAGSIFGGISASKAMKKVKRNLQDQRAANKDWYERRYNEDATQRADAQSVLARTEETIRERNRAAQGAQAVMGGTEESVAAEKAANAGAMAEAAAHIAVEGDRRKDSIEQTFLQRDKEAQDALNNMEIGKAKQLTEAIGGVGHAAAGIAEAF